MRTIRTTEILDDLERGLTRTRTSAGYDPELGCIQDKYELTNKELKYLFSQPSLKGKRVKLPVRFNLVDDTQEIMTYGSLTTVRQVEEILSAITADRVVGSTLETVLQGEILEIPGENTVEQTNTPEPVDSTGENW